ncbi:MAG TPA: hypothetical protein VK921_18100 [Anditalea sp.]|nr:hypothetical protein [Anditalea sp.]
MTIHNSFVPKLLYLLIFIIFSNCGAGSNSGENNQSESDNINSNEVLKDEVISIHDEVMPKMGALRSHQKRLTDEAAQLELKDSIKYDEEIEKRKRIARDLGDAYDGMFVWMRQYRPQLDEMGEEEGRLYLLEQKEKVIKVNEDIKSALAQAEETTIVDL